MRFKASLRIDVSVWGKSSTNFLSATVHTLLHLYVAYITISNVPVNVLPGIAGRWSIFKGVSYLHGLADISNFGLILSLSSSSKQLCIAYTNISYVFCKKKWWNKVVCWIFRGRDICLVLVLSHTIFFSDHAISFLLPVFLTGVDAKHFIVICYIFVTSS